MLLRIKNDPRKDVAPALELKVVSNLHEQGTQSFVQSYLPLAYGVLGGTVVDISSGEVLCKVFPESSTGWQRGMQTKYLKGAGL